MRSTLLVFSALTVVFFWREVCTGKFYCWGDVMLQFWPWRHFTRELMLEGTIPFWNPYLFCGLPFAANPQTALFYPPNWLSLPLPAYASVTWGVVLHVWLCGVFMVLLLRSIGCSAGAQLIGACAFAFGGIVARLQFPSHIVVLAALPCLLYVLERCRQHPEWRWALGVAGAWVAMLLGGHANMDFIVLMLVGLYLAWDTIIMWRSQQRDAAKQRGVIFAGGLCVGTALAAVQWLPTAELLANSARTGFTGEQAQAFALPPWQQVVWLFPDFFGNPARSSYWGEGNFFEASPYIGVAPLLLAVMGAAFSRHRLRPLMMFVLVVGLLLGMGYYAPFYPAAVRCLPFLAKFRAAGRWLVWASFAASVLAALGWDAVAANARSQTRLRHATAALALVGAVIGIALILLPTTLCEPLVGFVLRRTVKNVESLRTFTQGVVPQAGLSALPTVLVSWACSLVLLASQRLTRHKVTWLLVGVVFADLFRFGSGLHPVASADLFAIRPDDHLRGDLRIVTPPKYIKSVWDDYVSYQRFIMPKSGNSPFAGPLKFHLPGTNMVTGVLNADGYEGVRLRSYDRLVEEMHAQKDASRWSELAVHWCLTRSSQGSMVLRDVPNPLPRAYFTRPPAAHESAVTPATLVDRVNRVEIAGRANVSDCVLKDVWYPGWHAYLDDKSVRLHARDGFRRASAGGSRLVFVFQNEALIVGGCVSLLALSLLCAGVVAGVCRPQVRIPQ